MKIIHFLFGTLLGGALEQFLTLMCDRNRWNRNDIVHTRSEFVTAADSKASPFYQNLPDCTSGYKKIEKKTSAKALLCPMIR